MATLPSNKTWKIYGKKAPYFGVFGQIEYINRNLTKETLSNFFSSGGLYVEELFNIIYKKIDPDFKARKILDFGCGPGRMIIPFSKYADEVIGIDISEDMLKEAKQNCTKFNVNNASFYLSDKRLKCIESQQFDLVHSFIVLQHLNIKKGEEIIKILINSIANEGIGVLHITYFDNFPNRKIINYFRFRIPFSWFIFRFFHSIKMAKPFHWYPQMQMNNYNLNRLFELLQKNNFKEVFSIFTNHHDYWGVTLIFKKNEDFKNIT